VIKKATGSREEKKLNDYIHQFQKQLRNLWEGFTERARTLVLRGFATLADAMYISNHPELGEQDLIDWFERDRSKSHQRLCDEDPWATAPLTELFELLGEIGTLINCSFKAVAAFLSGSLTLAQMRLAAYNEFSDDQITDLADENVLRDAELDASGSNAPGYRRIWSALSPIERRAIDRLNPDARSLGVIAQAREEDLLNYVRSVLSPHTGHSPALA
jgi:hypothetical protein